MMEFLFGSFVSTAIVASLLVGLVMAYLGLFVVLRRMVFVGASLAQLGSAGVALSLLLAWPIQVGAGLLTLLGVIYFALAGEKRRIPADASVGVAYAAAGAAGVLLMAFVPHGEADMMGLLFGNILGVDPEEVLIMAGVFALVLLIQGLFCKEFVLTSFDPTTARTLGYRVELWNLALFMCLGAAITVGIRFAGVLLVFSFLVFPPLIGLLLGRRWWSSALLSVGSACLASGAGVWASVTWDLPTSAAIVAVTFGLYLAASLLRAAVGG